MTGSETARSRRLPRVLWLGIGVVLGSAAALTVLQILEARAGDQPPAAMDTPRFVEETASAGLEHVYDGDFRFFVGGGVAVLDCDGDGRPDLYIAGGSNPAGMFRNRSAHAGDLRFDPVPSTTTDLTEVTGAYPIDLDGDGRIDLVVLRAGENVLLRNLGDCRFERANERWGFDGGDDWTVAFSATWEPSAALPTLAFGNYLDAEDDQRATCTDSTLVRPVGTTASFADPIPLSPSWCTLSLLFSDWDRSGRRDLRVANDRHYYRDGSEQLWRIDAGETPRLYSEEDGWQPLQIWGMGIASHDLTGDGLPEVFLTSQGDNKLQSLADGPARPHYRDIAIDRGVTAHRPHVGGDVAPSTAWHAEFQDVNNDGLIDLYVAKGNVDAIPEFAARDPNNLLLGQADGSFLERAEAAGIVGYDRTRGAALVDLNLDGMLDLVEVNRRAEVRVWRNVGWGTAAEPVPMGNWAALRLEQAGPNHHGIGAWIEVDVDGRRTWREVTAGGGHAGGQLGWHHLGLGPADQARVRIQWPDGGVGPWFDLPADRFVVVERGTSAPRPWTPQDQ